MDPDTPVAGRRLPGPRFGTLILGPAACAVLVLAGVAGGAGAPAAGASHARSASSKQSQTQSKHKKNKGKSKQSGAHPCLVGNWDVTNMTLSTSGLSFTGGTGTTVDIMSNGNALGNFTPGTPLTGAEGSAKFNGTITDHYGFSSKTTATSGTFSSVTNVSDNATITVAGRTEAVSPSPETGTYACSGKDLTLTFTSNGNILKYQLVPIG
ncbi:MAG TPA: hypothetical protein VK773_04435 [Acidimicrobiales bacterium]|jgi:hypothetical protein|nr:hypothetical protein [Acidimicrobiales bacterium]